MFAEFILLLITLNLTSALMTNCFVLPNVNLVGGTYDEFESDNITGCCMRCADSQCCMAYTYNKLEKRCYLKSSINYSDEDGFSVSGLKSNTNGGRGVRLRNIRITGDRENRIELNDPDDCSQYCNAYNVYSWIRTQNEVGELSGDCSCMTRIKNIKYKYGCVSEIKPMN